MLNPEIFQKAIKHLRLELDLDFFASRLNIQLPKYISYKPDACAYLIDVFSIHWGFYNYYLFSSFRLIGQTLQKICIDQTEVAHVVPEWSTYSCYNSSKEILS